ncbi:MAG TPA: T9SS type A sorting domain-containing protein, partial [Balneolales bacterium]|nr:T9SS type A sorting domain-containing protein [Balneolales bacterium]
INRKLGYSKVVLDTFYVSNYGSDGAGLHNFKIPDPIICTSGYRIVVSMYGYGVKDTTESFSIALPNHRDIGIKNFSDSVLYDNNVYPLYIKYRVPADTISVDLISNDTMQTIYRGLLHGKLFFEGQDVYNTVYWKIPAGKYKPGEYYIMAFNQYGMSARTKSFIIKNRTDSIIFSRGWNLLSYTTHGDSLRADSVLSTNIVYSYSKGYRRSNYLTNGHGYWAYMTNADTVNYRQNDIDSILVKTYKGWNLIGSPYFNINTYDLVQYGGSLEHYVYEFDNGYKLTHVMTSGKGYWIYIPYPGYLLLKSMPLEKMSVGFDLAKYNSVAFSDSTNIKSTIYFSDHRDSTNYLLPPEPPGNMFDARLLSDSLICYDQKVKVRLQGAKGTIQMRIKGNEQDLYKVEISTGANKSIYHVYADSTLSIPSSVNQVIIYNPLLTDVKDAPRTPPESYSLSNNYPNPFNPTTNIKYSIPKAGHVLLQVYNMLGQRVATLVDKQQNAGYYTISFNASQLASGVYFYRIKAGSFVKTQKMMLIK